MQHAGSMPREVRKRVIEIYTTEDGRQPFKDWFLGLKDKNTRARISRYIDRLEIGLLGDFKGVGDGVFELRLFFGPGYRIYFAEHGEVTVVLLLGGDKGTQAKDIETAKTYWKNYKERLS